VVVCRRAAVQRQRVVAARAAASTPTTAAAPAPAQQAANAYDRLKGIELIRCSDGARVEIPSLWDATERSVVVWARTFGCPFCCESSVAALGIVCYAALLWVAVYFLASG